MTTQEMIILENFKKVLSSLTEKERSVIDRRIGLTGQKETLQEIGNSYGITRERVRQIEDVGIKKIGRIVRSTHLAKIQESGEKIIKLHAGLVVRDRLVTAIIEDLGIEGAVNDNIIDILLQADFTIQKSKPQLGTQTYFFSPEINKKLIDAIHKESIKILKKKGDIIENSTLYEMIKINLFAQFGKVDVELIDSVLDVFLDVVKGEEKYV